nr:PHP domain-containing protein [Maliibacterium massiliense]
MKTMPRLLADYHTHTSFSDGKGSIRDNVRAALARGLTCIGITDHSIGHVSYGIKRADVQRMRDTVDELNDQYAGRIRVLLGVETNLLGLNGAIDLPEDMRRQLDLVIMGYHRFVWPARPRDYFLMQGRAALPGSYKSEAFRQHMSDGYIAALGRHKIDILAHPGEYVPLDMRRVAPQAVARDTIIEINGRHPGTVEMVRQALAAGARFVLSSDAHLPARVGQVEKAWECACAAGVPPSRIENIEHEA